MSIEPSLDELQRAGFPMGGEPLVALDLVDTLMTAVEPSVDLLAPPGRAGSWWRIQGSRLPDGPAPDPASTARLRAAIRDLLDSHLAGRPARATSIEDVNATAASVPVSPRLVAAATGGLAVETRWHTEHGGNAALAAIARETVELFAEPDRLEQLRRCANPACSMLFLADNKRRKWCAPNVCGNRVRVARHYERTHPATVAPMTDGPGEGRANHERTSR
jgi:predicted RNA-binding Zn ribbon-like protein